MLNYGSAFHKLNKGWARKGYLMKKMFRGATVLSGGEWKPDHNLVVEGGYIAAVQPQKEASDFEGSEGDVIDVSGLLLVPGFIDVQVNGGGGVLFNSAPTLDAIRTIAEAHRAFGTTGLLPTLISDDLEVVEAAIGAVDDAIAEDVPGILGIHIEGPFLNAEKKGVHNASKFRVLDDAAIDLLSSLQRGVTHVTLAPEQTTPERITALVERGVIVSAGHTAAPYEDIMLAVGAGLSGFTHLYNAMTGLDSRAPGVVGAALDARDTYAGIIADGHHVHPASLRAAIRAKGADKIMLVTDAMPSVGTAQKHFTLQGVEVMVEGGKCITKDGTLAGSDLDMASAVRFAVDQLNVSLEVAIGMASGNPARFIGLGDTYGDIKPGMKASFVVMDKAGHVQQTWIDGSN